MKCEVEFLAVGKASKAGDAIVVRYGDVSQYKLMVVDCGMAETGIEMAAHLKKYFGQLVHIDDVVLTHPDTDHACGIRELLERIPARNLWLIPPWSFAARSLPYFADKRWTADGLAKEIRKEYDIIADIVNIAQTKGIAISMPFQGTVIGAFTILTPSTDAYAALMPQFDRTPEPDKDALEAIGMWLGTKPSALQRYLAAMIEKAAATVQQLIPESWAVERLKDGGVTSASNESSLVLYGVFENGPILLTGDAGNWALNRAANYATALGVSLGTYDLIQIPHHGSRSNVGPSILNRILGPILPENIRSGVIAYVSAPADDSTHPRKMVTNAFIRRGTEIIATQGQNKIRYGGFPARPDYVNVTPLPFSDMVEDYD